MENTIKRTAPCAECGADVIWTQNAWRAKDDSDAHAAYRCLNGHVLDPSTTRQCPVCGVHDTSLRRTVDGREEFQCAQCGETFMFPR